MTDLVRSVGVRLSANTTQYLTAMRAAGAETEAVSNRTTRTIKSNGLTQEKALKAVGTTAKFAAGVVGFGLYEATKQAASFGAEMALVKTLSHASNAQMVQLSKTALTVGQNIGYSAHQVADGEAELIKAGISIKEILGGALTGALNLAAAGQIDLGQATEIAASAMTQFKLKGKDVPHLADLLAAGADKALGSVQDLGEGLKQSGTTAHQMGLDVDQTVGTLAAFAQAGLIGERGGTTFKQMLLQLAAPTNKASDLMESLHLSLYKANGQIKTMPQLADNLQKSLGKLTPAQRNYALGVIFGSRAIQGANILLADGGKGIDSWIKKVNDQGFAAHQASGKLDSLSGDFDKLKSATENAFIELGSGTQSPLRQFVQNTTGKIREVTENGDLQKWSKEIGGDLKQAAQDAEPFAKVVGGSLKNLAHDAHLVADAFNSLPKGVQQMIVTGGLLAYGANKIGVLKPLVNSFKGGGAAGALGGSSLAKGVVPVYVTNMSPGGALTAGEGAGAAAGSAAGRGGAAAAEGGGLLAGLRAILGGGKVPNIVADGGLKLGTLGRLTVGGFSAGGAGSEVGGAPLLNLKKLTAAQTQSLYHSQGLLTPQELRDEALLKKGLMLPEQTANPKAGIGKAGPTGALPDAAYLAKYKGFLDSLPKKVETKFYTPGAIQSASDVRALGKQFNLTPKQVRTLITLSGVPQAKSELTSLHDLLGGLHDKTVHVNIKGQGKGAGVLQQQYGGGFPNKGTAGVKTPADGGYISGPGGPRDDVIPAWLSNGEYVMPADVVNHYGLDAMDDMRAKRFADGGLAGRKKPLFTQEGPQYYAAAYRHNKAFAKAGPESWPLPYQTDLHRADELAFERWVKRYRVPFDAYSRLTDYDMRGYWKRTAGKGWKRGMHFPDTYKTPYDTTFSHESKYATKNNPFYWHGNRLVDQRNGQLIFAANGGLIGSGRRTTARRMASGGSVGGLRNYVTHDLDMKFPSTLKQWQEALKKSTAAIDKETSARDDLVQQKSDFATDLTSSLRQDPFSTDRPDSFQYMTAAQRQAYFQNNAVTVANQNAKNGAAYAAALKTLTSKGLSGAALQQLAGTGDLEQVQAIAGESKGQLAALAASVNAGNAATSKAGKYGAAVSFDPQLSTANAHLAESNQHLKDIKAEIRRHGANSKASKGATSASTRTRRKKG